MCGGSGHNRQNDRFARNNPNYNNTALVSGANLESLGNPRNGNLNL